MRIEFFGHKKDYFFAPLYYLQAKHVAKTALRLPEPMGDRVASFGQGVGGLSVGIFGDSAGAGVGVAHQDDAPFGQIGTRLAKQLDTRIQMHLHATSGHRSFELLHRLYAMPKCHFDVAIVSIGVNDVIKRTSNQAWADNLHGIITIFKQKFGVRHLIFLSLPPMHLAPSLPTPLNGLIGRRAGVLSTILQSVCTQYADVHYVKDEFDKANLHHQVMFAEDGFHPSHLTYQVWADTLARYTCELVC